MVTNAVLPPAVAARRVSTTPLKPSTATAMDSVSPKVQGLLYWQDTARTGDILEAMAAFSAYTLTPAYYDKTLMGKSVRDAESEPMPM